MRVKAAAPTGSGRDRVARAAEVGNTELVRKAIAAGADVNVKNKDGFTAVAFAAVKNNTEMLDMLLAAIPRACMLRLNLTPFVLGTTKPHSTPSTCSLTLTYMYKLTVAAPLHMILL